MSQITLDGEWQLYFAPESEQRVKTLENLVTSGLTPIPAKVPGNVELDLLRAGRIVDPFFGDHIRELRPYEFYEWWYQRTFELDQMDPTQNWELIFDGLDTIANIWVNGTLAGTAQNMLIEHRFNVASFLNFDSKNEIVVHIQSAVNHARKFQYDAVLKGPDAHEESIFVRKPPHSYGWDIMPRAVSAGIWRGVRLESRSETAIEQIYYWTDSINYEGAELGVSFQFRTDAPNLDDFRIHFHGQSEDHDFDYDWPCEFTAGRCLIPVPGAKLWWPKGYGDANLYTITATLFHHDTTVAEKTDRIGIRKITIDRTEAAGPTRGPQGSTKGIKRIDQNPDMANHFVVYANDVPIMVKGSNWVPLDAFHSRDAERYDSALELFNDLGCNMIRCWGGNVYEDHHFFNRCDEFGILVWQDFAFACAFYPQTDNFQKQVGVEIQSVVEKLRNHPSLALWCGDNEIDGFYAMHGLSPEENRLTRETIPQMVHRCDPQRHFIPSSPYVPKNIADEPDVWTKTPEQHLWGPRGYFKSPFYTHHSAHFIGEMGYHGCPNPASIQKFISPEKLWPWQNNDEWRLHDVAHTPFFIKNRDRIKLMANQIRELFGEIPDNLADFALASQITQAEAKKFFVESTRMRKWHTSGVLWWNVLDGWPQFSDAIVDYYFGKKLAYYYLKRAQLPVCMFIGEPGPGKYLPVIISNDSREAVDVTYRVWENDSNQTLAEGQLHLPANENWQVSALRTYASDQKLYLLEWTLNGKTFGNHHISGSPAFSLDRYREWLKKIAQLPDAFALEKIAK